MLAAEINVEAIIGGDLRQSAGTAGPARIVVDLVGVKIAVGIIEGAAVGEKRLGAENGVVHDALHTVTVGGISIDAKKIAGQFEVRVGTARRFKTAVRFREAGGEIVAVRGTQLFVRTPAAGGETLLRKHGEGVGG